MAGKGTALRSDDPRLRRLEGLHPQAIDLSLDRVRRLLADLGHPEVRLPPAVHVAGTNGKGSTIAFLRAILEAAGYRVHVYTSPHLVRFNERVRLGGRLISDEDLVAVLDEAEQVNAGRPITFFEITTAAAFLAFSQQPADVLLLETGLGGRLDATNVLDKPLLTVLTPISLDHQDFLGSSMEEIAGEKAGILKPGVPCVTAKLSRKTASVVRARAQEVAASLHEEGPDWFATKMPQGLTLHEGHSIRRLPDPVLIGPHQVRNAALAVVCVDFLRDLKVPPAAIELGLRSVTWPGRLQRIAGGPLAKLLPDGWELWLDGGHNPAAAAMLAQQARGWRGMPLHLVLGMTKPRDPDDFVEAFAGRVASLQAVPVPGTDRSIDPEAIAAFARVRAIPAASAPDVATALERIAAAGGTPSRVLVCGSLYLIGDALDNCGEDYWPA
ncbi:MAG: bifunctional folylpolyglutamate synthase/dihydrofolate synthase [Magnetospirillum sp. WYHS-4]